MGSHPELLYFHFSPLEGSLCWVMDKSDLEALLTLLLTQRPKSLSPLDPDFTKGFYQFVAAQTLELLNQLDFDNNLSPSVTVSTELPTQDSLCVDVKMTIDSKTVMGRAIIPPELRQSWKERYADRKLAPDYSSSLGQKIQVIIHLEAGKTVLTQKEWKDLSPGDFLILDQCTLEPEVDKGRIMMTVDNVPMFRARLKQGNIKILEYPLFHAVEAPMISKDDEFDDTEFDEEFDEETFEEGVQEEEPMHQPEPAAAHAEDEELEQAPPPVTSAPSEKKASIKPEELPIQVVIEVGRLQMSIQKLMELQPGNTLELDIHPEDGVDLVVNGRRVGKGELLKIGETLGVRVLDLG
jgi:flagellar motor switch protein FliN/FliY